MTSTIIAQNLSLSPFATVNLIQNLFWMMQVTQIGFVSHQTCILPPIWLDGNRGTIWFVKHAYSSLFKRTSWILAACASPLQAQTAQLTGFIQDPSQSGVPNAEVRIARGTGQQRPATTNTEGTVGIADGVLR